MSTNLLDVQTSGTIFSPSQPQSSVRVALGWPFSSPGMQRVRPTEDGHWIVRREQSRQRSLSSTTLVKRDLAMPRIPGGHGVQYYGATKETEHIGSDSVEDCITMIRYELGHGIEVYRLTEILRNQIFGHEQGGRVYYVSRDFFDAEVSDVVAGKALTPKWLDIISTEDQTTEALFSSMLVAQFVQLRKMVFQVEPQVLDSDFLLEGRLMKFTGAVATNLVNEYF